MVWNHKSNEDAANIKNELLQEQVGLGQSCTVETELSSNNRRTTTTPWHVRTRTDEVVGEGQPDLDDAQAHFREIFIENRTDDEYRKLCLKVAREFAEMKDFETARRYLESNYLGPNPSNSEEYKQMIIELKRRILEEKNRNSKEPSRNLLNNSQPSTSETSEGTRSHFKRSSMEFDDVILVIVEQPSSTVSGRGNNTSNNNNADLTSSRRSSSERSPKKKYDKSKKDSSSCLFSCCVMC